MVLESSQDIKKATTSLLDFSPEHMDVTLQGPPSINVSASSHFAMILSKLPEHADKGNNFNLSSSNNKEGHNFHGRLLQDYSMEIENNNDSSDYSHSFIKHAEADKARTFIKDESWKNSDINIMMNQHLRISPEIINEQTLHSTRPKLDRLCGVDLDSLTSPGTSDLVTQFDSHDYNTDDLSLKRTTSCSSFSSSSSEGMLGEDIILTDPRYAKKIEQALKLGYSEQDVTKVLTKLGPDCTSNDLLSELIKLGPSDSNLLSAEADLLLTNNCVDHTRPDYMSQESADISGFFTPEGLEGSLDSSFLDADSSGNLRYIIIDGSNVAMSHGKTAFSCKGIRIAVDWFLARGHKNITVFIPQWRKETSRPDAPITDQEILYELENQGIVVFTPARRVKGRRVICYDDRFVLKLAVDTDGIVVSNDVYRDLVNEKEDFRRVVDQRLLMYSFVNDRFMPPEDPLGRLGPTLDDFLRKTPAEPNLKPQDCPYGKKCTYGNKCRFYHPERGFGPQKSVTEALKEQAHLKLQERASKMSEIAEKGRRPKQKLSRTKSLMPGEPLPAPGGESKNKHGKPKLGHSKSLVFPPKSSDYLNEPRKKLEEAELAAALDKLSARDASFIKRLPTEVCPQGESDKKMKGLRSSLAPQKSVFQQNTSVTDSHLKQTSPLKSLSMNSPQPASLLTVPKVESPEGYVSGHLLVAKKLSDENNESSFFSEHTSSTSARASPIISSGKATEQKHFFNVDTCSTNRHDDSSRYSALSPQFHHSFLQQQLAFDPETDQHFGLANTSSLSISDDGASQCWQKYDSGITLPTDRYQSVDNSHFTDYTSPNVDPRSPDSGLFASPEYKSSSFQNHFDNSFQVLKSYPLSKAEEALLSQQQISLHRAYSSTDNVRTAENSHKKPGRRLSGFTVSHLEGEHALLKQQHSVPAHQKANTHQFTYPHGLNRQNSNSDPQIHNINGTGQFQNMPSSIFCSEYPAPNFDHTFYSQSQQCQRQFQHSPQQTQHISQQQRQFENQDQFQRQQQQEGFSQLFPHLISKTRMDSWGQPVSQVNLDHVSSLSAATQGQYRPHQNTASVPSNSHISYFPASTNTQNLVTASSHNYTSFRFPYPPPPLIPSTPYGAASTSVHSQPTRHGFSSHSIYPHNSSVPQSNIQSLQSTMKSTILSEDSSILPEDPRYSIYYHLSNVFGEQIVRKVLNLNPSALNPDQVCRLIIKYKEEVGNQST